MPVKAAASLFRSFSWAYLVIVLAITAAITIIELYLPFIIVAYVLIALVIRYSLRPTQPEVFLSVMLAAFILIPFTIQPMLGSYLSVLITLPILIVIDRLLKETAGSILKTYIFTQGIHITGMARALITACSLVFMTSLLLLNATIALASALLLVYFIVMVIREYARAGPTPIKCSRSKGRTFVGESISVPWTMDSEISLHVSLKPLVERASVNPASFTISPGQGVCGIFTMTPTLAITSKIALNAFMVGTRGLIATSQVLEPVDLHIIPRLKYAEWLAKKYLIQTALEYAPSMATPPIMSQKPMHRGVDYYGSRPYQMGDSIKDVDWRQTYRVQELIVKEFSRMQPQPAIILANLTAGDAEEADLLAYDLITTALTMVRGGMPTALAAYDRKGVVETTPLISPREVLKKSLLLTKRITVESQNERVLQLVNLLRLKRNAELLSSSKMEKVRRMGDLLKFELEVVQEVGSGQPSSFALKKIVSLVKPPAVVISISAGGRKSEAIEVNMRRMCEKGYVYVFSIPQVVRAECRFKRTINDI